MLVWSLFVVSIVLLFFPSLFLYFLISAFSSFLYGIYLIYDTQLIVGGRVIILFIQRLMSYQSMIT